ncbi:CHEK2 [Bugula neritina]|uniref:CHEK2 n=1 Tax=Bugula neritina TaxID=10212 RepID=A0A7J7K0R0_BUGNE|nr:CHEK2 [Bugula neritina]
MHKENDDVPNLVKAKYRVLSDLGSGACGLVKLAVRKSDCLRVACKCIDKSKFNFPSNSSKVQLMKEVSILKALDHPCVIKVVDVIDTEKMLCIFMELAEAGDLFKEIKLQTRLEPDHAKMVFYQTCLAVKHLHDHNVVHRDLKPENILLSNTLQSHQIVKVTDFGYSCVMDTSSLLKTLCGTPYYIAPEIVVSHGMGGGYTKAVDCWSLGVILYVCITGQPAFTTERKDLCLKDQILQEVIL